jgi:hypothetical protein
MTNQKETFDFGFIAVDESELESTVIHQEAAATAQEKLEKLHSMILPLLQNLKKNPEKDYIKWPNRVKKVEEFEALVNKIVNS